jgi:asparagine synthase (glutamine-hydrolysing)
MVAIFIRRYFKTFGINSAPKMNRKKIYKAKSLYPHNLRQALYFDQQTYLRSLLYRNDRVQWVLQ